MAKSLEAVFHPDKFTVLERVRNRSEFEALWDENRIAALAGLAHAAYLDRKDPDPEGKDLDTVVVGRFGAHTCHAYDEDGAQGFLALWDEFGVVAFRGSEPAEDEPIEVLSKILRLLAWAGIDVDESMAKLMAKDGLADVTLLKVGFDHPLDRVRVHAGFLGEFKKLWDLIQDDLPDGLPVWVTGHSLGAAIATLAGLSHEFEVVVTFGEPRVGAGVGRHFRAGNHVRVVNGDDPVTKVPLRRLGMYSYEHHGEKVPLTDPDGSTDFKYDHSIVYYVDNLLAKGNGSTPEAG